MKTKNYLNICTALLFLSTTSYAQLKVVTGGNVGIGTIAPSQKLEVQGSILTTSYGKLYLHNTNKYIGTTSPTSDLGIVSKDNGAWLRIGSNGGIAFWGQSGVETNGNHNAFINQYGLGIGVGAYAYNGVSLLVSGNVLATGAVWENSDIRFKQNINQIESGLEKVLKLNGKTYSFDKNKYPEMQLPEGTTYGFIAQELKEVLPDAVKQDDKGFYSVNYSSVIPVLTEAIKEQQKQIEKLKTTIEQQQLLLNTQQVNINECCSSNQNNTSTSINNNIVPATSKLYPNNPNPFTEKTIISFDCEVSAKDISLLVFNIQGQLVKSYKSISSTNGKGNLTINGNELEPGIYIYALIIDGKEIDSKRMILTK